MLNVCGVVLRIEEERLVWMKCESRLWFDGVGEGGRGLIRCLARGCLVVDRRIREPAHVAPCFSLLYVPWLTRKLTLTECCFL